ncbi:MAG: hypothetical protein WBD17_07070 [Candidatus Omnitrophota bacterium]
MKKTETIEIKEKFEEIGSKAIDSRNRVSLGDVIKVKFKRVKLYKSDRGEILIMPVVEIPASEAWLFENKKALASVKRGLEQATQGKGKELDLESLDKE